MNRTGGGNTTNMPTTVKLPWTAPQQNRRNSKGLKVAALHGFVAIGAQNIHNHMICVCFISSQPPSRLGGSGCFPTCFMLSQPSSFFGGSDWWFGGSGSHVHAPRARGANQGCRQCNQLKVRAHVLTWQHRVQIIACDQFQVQEIRK